MALSRTLFLTLVINIGLIQSTKAEETDQFTLPNTELLDLGLIASSRLFKEIKSAVDQTNREIRLLESRAQNNRYAALQLKSRLQGTHFADLVYSKTGPGYPRWLPRKSAPGETKPILYNESKPWKTVYWLAFSQSPLSLIGLAPTIRMYNYYFGTDKLGHFFMVGHNYYKLYTYYIAHGKSTQQAHAAIVTYGKILESTYLGILINGIYSNGDLAANYAGWKFYMNLTQKVKIGDYTLPAILILKGNQWEFSKHVSEESLLMPYLSDNLNEALNPSRYTFSRDQIRKQIKKRCADWVERKGITQSAVKAKLEESRHWHGEDYGHWLPTNSAVTLATCFGGR